MKCLPTSLPSILPLLFNLQVIHSFHSFTKIKRPFLQPSTKRTKLQQNVPFYANVISEQSNKATTTSPSEPKDDIKYISMFDFSTKEKADKSIECFERIDDVIMGGISTSTLMLPIAIESGDYYASWSGICRTDGGGFCGFRTLPFKEPYFPSDNTTCIEEVGGIYAKVKFTSDDEPNRRIWKFTTRTDESRGEQVYQAQFKLPEGKNEEFHTIQIPFKDFKVVRGARMVPNSPSINISKNGIYQIGMTCSKFIMALNTTELDNFRGGYFNLHIQDIGIYTPNEKNMNEIQSPQTLTSLEAKKKQSMIFKILRPIFSLLLFSEESNRRKSALKILMTKRNLSRWGAFVLGVKYRTKSLGFFKGGIGKTFGIVGSDCIRFLFGNVVRYCLVQPLFLLLRIINGIKGKKGKTN